MKESSSDIMRDDRIDEIQVSTEMSSQRNVDESRGILPGSMPVCLSIYPGHYASTFKFYGTQYVNAQQLDESVH